MGFVINRNSIIYEMMISGKRFRIYTGISTKAWVKSEQRVSKDEDFYWEKNLKLEQIEREMTRIKMKSKVEGFIPTEESIKAHLFSNPKPDSENILIWQFVEQFVEDKTASLQPNTVRKFRTLGSQFKEDFPTLFFNELTASWYQSYINFLLDKELLNNTIADKVKCLKLLCKYAYQKGIPVNSAYLNFRFKPVKYPPIWLDWEKHLPALEEIELEGLGNDVRNRFLFRCYTGIREGELNQLEPENFYRRAGRQYLKYWDMKGKKNKSIQISTAASALAERLNYELPKMAQQTENRVIKVILQRCKVTEMKKVIRHSGSKEIVMMKPLAKLVSSHTARRTFARRWYEQGGDLKKLSKYLGHSSIRTTEIYIGVENEEVNDELMRVMG